MMELEQCCGRWIEPISRASTDQRNRCPGGGDHKSQDGSRPWKPTPDFNCDPSQVLSGK